MFFFSFIYFQVRTRSNGFQSKLSRKDIARWQGFISDTIRLKKYDL